MVIGGFQVVARLAAGDSSCVYLGERLGAGGFVRRVAIKVPRRRVTRDPQRLAQFLANARLAARLRHPNVAGVLELKREGGGIFMVNELSDGPTVADISAHSRSMPPTVAVYLAIQVLNAVHAVITTSTEESLGAVHCSLRPEHILVDEKGSVKVTGFVAALTEKALAHAADDVYVAPETFDGGLPTQQSTQFVLGLILWELLTGRKLRAGRDGTYLRAALQRHALPRLRDVVPGIPPAVDEIVHRALSPIPASRFATCRGFSSVLELLAAPLGMDANDPRPMAQFLRADGLLGRFRWQQHHYALRHPIPRDQRHAATTPGVGPSPLLARETTNTLTPAASTSTIPPAAAPKGRGMVDSLVFAASAAAAFAIAHHGLARHVEDHHSQTTAATAPALAPTVAPPPAEPPADEPDEPDEAQTEAEAEAIPVEELPLVQPRSAQSSGDDGWQDEPIDDVGKSTAADTKPVKRGSRGRSGRAKRSASFSAPKAKAPPRPAPTPLPPGGNVFLGGAVK